jgi:quercetin dioxygenase-like cupin family protein
LGAAAVVLLLGFGGHILAQNPAPNPGLTRTTLAQGDLSAPGRETVVMRVQLAPGAEAGWHTHPGEEISYMIEGEITLLVAGQAPRKVPAGQALIVPAGAVHNARNDGTIPAVLVAVYVVEKGRPLRSAAPEPAH